MTFPTIRYDTDILAWANSVEFDPKPTWAGLKSRTAGDSSSQTGEPSSERVQANTAMALLRKNVVELR
jgi:hypothetical protein